MSKETRKFKVRVIEEIHHTHEIEIPVDDLINWQEQQDEDCDVDVSNAVRNMAWEYMDYPNHVSDTLIDVDYGMDTEVEYLGQVDLVKVNKNN